MKSLSPLILATLLGSGAAMANEKAIDFSRHDRNGDGYLTHSEWTDVGKIDAGFNELDRNGDQLVDKQEIRQSRIALKSSRQGSMSQAPMAQGSAGGASQQANSMQGNNNGFERADRNGDGRVSQSEAGNAGYDYVAIYYDPIDADGDGYLDENEWDLNEVGGGMYDDGVDDFNEAAGAFDYYDANDDGFLDEDEAAEDDYVESNFDSWDNNDDGLIDIGEAEDDFMEWDSGAFDTYDVNDDGLLDEEEIDENDFVDVNFNEWDSDGDGFLDEDEASETWYDDDDTFGSDY